MERLCVRKLMAGELTLLASLFSYSDMEDMLRVNRKRMAGGEIDIFGLFCGAELLGELRAMYVHEDRQFALRGQRAYLYAFRIREDVQGRGLGTILLEQVLSLLQAQGYREFTIGVEEENRAALHLYQKFGFTELVAQKEESYQGDSYSFNLYLKR